MPTRLPIMQYAYVVDDLDTAIGHWVEALGVGPFFVLRNVAVVGSLYRGKPVHTHHSVAMGQAGDAQIELIQVHSEPPHIYSDHLGVGGTGFHHVAVLADDFDATVAELSGQGLEIVQQHEYKGTRLCYFDTTRTLRYFLEVLENTEFLAGLLAKVRDAHPGWDGITDPIRPLI